MKQYNSLRKKESSPLDINKTNDYSDRGVELILSGGKRKLKKSFEIYFQNHYLEMVDLILYQPLLDYIV